MKVLFAPDWRAGVPYQTLLAAALAELGVKVEFLAGYKRALALTRLVRAREFDVLHLHWPDAYYPRMHDGFDWWRQARFATDLALATRRHPLVFTAHNFAPHNRSGEFCEERNARAPFVQARAVIAHSAAATRPNRAAARGTGGACPRHPSWRSFAAARGGANCFL